MAGQRQPQDSAPLSGAITNDVDKADRLNVLEGCHRVLGDAMDSMWTAWERFDQGEKREGRPPPRAPGVLSGSHLISPLLPVSLASRVLD